MKLQSSKNISTFKIKINIRTVWYSVLLWIATFLIAGVVIIPWFYLATAVIIVLTTIYYFKIYDPFTKKRGRKKLEDRDNILIFALVSALVWFLILILFGLAEIAGFYYFNFMFYLSDFRNWYIFALVLLVPVVYGLVLENAKFVRRNRRRRALAKPLSSAKIIW